MNNGNLPRAQQGSNPQQQGQPGLLRVEQIRSLPHLTDSQKTQYEGGVRALYEALQNHPPESPEYQAALNKLVEVSTSLRTSFKKWQMLQQQAVAAAAAAGQGQRLGPQPGQPPKPQGQAPAGSQGNHGPQVPQLQVAPQPPNILAHVQNFPFTLPPNIAVGSAEGEKWLAEAKSRYGQALQKAEVAKHRIVTMQTNAQQRHASGTPLTQDEMKEFNAKKAQYQRLHAEAKKYLDSFRQQQVEFKTLSQGPQSTVAATNATDGTKGVNQSEPHLAVPADQGSQPPQSAPNQDATGPNIRPGTEGTPEQAGGEGRTVASPATASQTLPAGQLGQAPPQPNSKALPISSQQSNSSVPTVYPQFSHQPPVLPQVNTGVVNPPRYAPHVQQNLQQQQQQNSPQLSRPPSITQLDRPQSLTHQAALSQASRSYSNGIQNSTPTSTGPSSHAHPPTTQEINSIKMPIPKTMNNTPPQPVAMGPSRPTFSGGASNGRNGIMGQPALPKMPGYVLEGEGERVLSKKKLDELVRQVTNGGEGLGGQLMAPDCEEVRSIITKEQTLQPLLRCYSHMIMALLAS